MQTIKIQTTQNIELEYELAGIGDRIVAYLVDASIYIAYFFTVSMLLSVTRTSGNEVFLILFLLLPIMFYQLLCEVFLNGQSLGKKVKNIRVISLNGNQPSLAQYLIRWMFRLVDMTMTSGVVAVLTVALSQRAQRVGDMLAGTAVVRTRTSTKFNETIYSETSLDYIPQFEIAGNLSESDISLLKEVVNRYKSDPESQALVLQKAYIKTKSVLMVYEDYDPLYFLETVIKDFNMVTGRAE